MNTVSRSLKNIAVFEMHINQEALQLEELRRFGTKYKK